MIDTTTPLTNGDNLLGHQEADWSIQRIEPGTIDRETGEVIPAGWWIAAHAIGEPENVWLNLHVDYAVDQDGNEISGDVARRLRNLMEATA